MTADLTISSFHPDRPGIRKVLGDLEAEIMEVIWSRPAGEPTTVRDVFEVLYAQRHLAYTTVMSTMTRLAKKHLLQVHKQEQAYAYLPTMMQEEFIAEMVNCILEDLFVSFSEATRAGVAGLADAQTVAQAHALLDEIARRRHQEEA